MNGKFAHDIHFQSVVDFILILRKWAILRIYEEKKYERRSNIAIAFFYVLQEVCYHVVMYFVRFVFLFPFWYFLHVSSYSSLHQLVHIAAHVLRA